MSPPCGLTTTSEEPARPVRKWPEPSQRLRPPELRANASRASRFWPPRQVVELPCVTTPPQASPSEVRTAPLPAGEADDARDSTAYSRRTSVSDQEKACRAGRKVIVVGGLNHRARQVAERGNHAVGGELSRCASSWFYRRLARHRSWRAPQLLFIRQADRDHACEFRLETVVSGDRTANAAPRDQPVGPDAVELGRPSVARA